MPNYRIHWETVNGYGAGFKTVTAQDLRSALAWGEAQCQPAEAYPKQPKFSEGCDHLRGAKMDAFHKEWDAIDQRNLSRKASVSEIRTERFFTPSIVIL